MLPTHWGYSISRFYGLGNRFYKRLLSYGCHSIISMISLNLPYTLPGILHCLRLSVYICRFYVSIFIHHNTLLGHGLNAYLDLAWPFRPMLALDLILVRRLLMNREFLVHEVANTMSMMITYDTAQHNNQEDPISS